MTNLNNPWGLPEHLVGMTQRKWDRLSAMERTRLRDRSRLHPKLVGLEGLEGQKVRVTPKRQFGASTFRVGTTTGWRPAHLAMRGNARGSSDLIRHDEDFLTVEIVR
jgi:hypothetical protein